MAKYIIVRTQSWTIETNETPALSSDTLIQVLETIEPIATEIGVSSATDAGIKLQQRIFTTSGNPTVRRVPAKVAKTKGKTK